MTPKTGKKIITAKNRAFFFLQVNAIRFRNNASTLIIVSHTVFVSCVFNGHSRKGMLAGAAHSSVSLVLAGEQGC